MNRIAWVRVGFVRNEGIDRSLTVGCMDSCAGQHSQDQRG